jgi:hypothetical protein
MRYVTINMLAKHTGKHPKSVQRALKRANVPVEKFIGVQGLRLSEKDANNFLRRQWPETGPLPPMAVPAPVVYGKQEDGAK